MDTNSTARLLSRMIFQRPAFPKYNNTDTAGVIGRHCHESFMSGLSRYSFSLGYDRYVLCIDILKIVQEIHARGEIIWRLSVHNQHTDTKSGWLHTNTHTHLAQEYHIQLQRSKKKKIDNDFDLVKTFNKTNKERRKTKVKK